VPESVIGAALPSQQTTTRTGVGAAVISLSSPQPASKAQAAAHIRRLLALEPRQTAGRNVADMGKREVDVMG